MSMSAVPMAVSSSADNAADAVMPCHEAPADAQQKSEHCKGLCLCLHMSLNQAPVLSDSVSYAVSFYNFSPQFSEYMNIASLSSSPLLRPPII